MNRKSPLPLGEGQGEGWKLKKTISYSWFFRITTVLHAYFPITTSRVAPIDAERRDKRVPTQSVGTRSVALPRLSFIIHHSSFVILLFALPSFAQQLPLLNKMPSDLLRYTGGARPDAEGLVGYNKDGFKSPEFQGRAMHYMVRAIVRATSVASTKGGKPSTPRFSIRRPTAVSAEKDLPTADLRRWPFGWPISIRPFSYCARAIWAKV